LLEDAGAAGVVAGAAADALAEVGVTAGALAEVGVTAGAVVGAVVGVVADAVPEAGDAGAVKVNAGDDGDVAPVLLADAVLEGDSMLATRTPTPSAAPLSSVTRGMLTFMPSSTQSRRFRVRSHSKIVRSCRGARRDRAPVRAGPTG
jgi:hypothetical protein